MENKIFNLKLGGDKYLWFEWYRMNALFDIKLKLHGWDIFSLSLSLFRFKLEYVNENHLPF